MEIPYYDEDGWTASASDIWGSGPFFVPDREDFVNAEVARGAKRCKGKKKDGSHCMLTSRSATASEVSQAVRNAAKLLQSGGEYCGFHTWQKPSTTTSKTTTKTTTKTSPSSRSSSSSSSSSSSTKVRCKGLKYDGSQCRVYSNFPYECAAPLREGKEYCQHHASQGEEKEKEKEKEDDKQQIKEEKGPVKEESGGVEIPSPPPSPSPSSSSPPPPPASPSSSEGKRKRSPEPNVPNKRPPE